VARARALLEREHCAACHNPDFSGREQIPRLANQREDYLVKALRDYKSGARIGYGNAAMAEAVSGLADSELLDLAHFLAFLPSAGAQPNSTR
jgi:cytochrome c553